MLEIAYQRDICKIIRAEGGHAKKWSNPDAPGVPDLICSHKRTGGTFLAEVKVLRDLTEKFNRSNGLTEIQQAEMKRFRSAGTWCVVMMVLEFRTGNKLLVVGNPTIENISNDDVFGVGRAGLPCVPWKRGPIIDMVVTYQRAASQGA